MFLLSVLVSAITLFVVSWAGGRVNRSAAAAIEPYILCSKQPQRFILRVILGVVLLYDRVRFTSAAGNVRNHTETNFFKILSPNFIPRMWVYWMSLNPSRELQANNTKVDPDFTQSIKRAAALIVAARNIATTGGVKNSGDYCFFGALHSDGDVKPTINSSYCTVGYDGEFFELELAQVKSSLEIEYALNSIVTLSLETRSGQYYSLATCGDIGGFCKIFRSLARDKGNAKTLSRLEGAAFHVSLEPDVVVDSLEDSAWALRAWPKPSRNYTNQLQVVVFRNAETALMFSHMNTHGVPAARLAGEIFRQSETELSRQKSATGKEPVRLLPRMLRWNLDDAVKNAAAAAAESTRSCVPSGKERAQLIWSYPLGMQSGAQFDVNIHALLCVALQMAAYRVDRHIWPLWVTAVDEAEEPVKAEPMVTREVIELLAALKTSSVYDVQRLNQKLRSALHAHSQSINPDSSRHFNQSIKGVRGLPTVLKYFFLLNPRYKHTVYVADLGRTFGVTAFGGAGLRQPAGGAVIKISRSDPRGAWIDVLLENGPLANKAGSFISALKESIHVLTGILTFSSTIEPSVELPVARRMKINGEERQKLQSTCTVTASQAERAKELLSFLKTVIWLDESEKLQLDEETPLAGLVDSLTMAKIAQFVTSRWGLLFSYRDFPPEQVYTVTGLVNHINKLQSMGHQASSQTADRSDMENHYEVTLDLKKIKAKGFLERLAAIAKTFPSAPFATYVSPDGNHRQVSYGELYARSGQRALSLREYGVARNDVVAIITLDDYEVAITFLASMRIGALPTVLAPPSPKVTPEHYAETLRGLIERSRPICVVTTPDLGQEQALRACFTSEQFLIPDLAGDEKNTCDITFIPGPDDIAFLQHSSGTTGLQKGVAVTYGMLEQQMQMLLTTLQYNNNDRIISWLPLYHDMGLIACMLFPMYSGGRLVQIPTFDWLANPLTLFEQITLNRATLCWLPNFAFLHLARSASTTPGHWDLTSMRAFINCSEPVQRHAFLKFRESAKPYGLRDGCLVASYAMAENVFAVTQTELDKDASGCWLDILSLTKGIIVSTPPNTAGAREMVSSGRIIPGNQLRIVDSNGCVIEGNSIGEIELSGPCTASTYYRNPEASSTVFRNGWYSTGDLGFIHQGEVYVTGRKKDLLIIRGENVHPQDLENAATESGAIHPGRAAAIGIANEETGTEEVVLLVERGRKSRLSDSEIVSRVRSETGNAVGLLVARILVLPHGWLVKSTSGKISRSKSLIKARAEGFFVGEHSAL